MINFTTLQVRQLLRGQTRISFLYFKKGEIQTHLNVTEKNPEEKDMLKILERKG